MTVLVTGATGFLGAATISAARAAGLAVTPVAHHASGGNVAVDLEDQGALNDVLNAVQPDAIINCAAIVDFGTALAASQYRVNSLAPAIMAAWAARQNALMVQASTIVIHGAGVERVGPSTPVNLDSNYARSKWLAEEMIRAAGCPAAIVRLGGLFGRGGPKHLRLNSVIEGARGGKVPTLVGAGSARRNYVYVADAAAALVQCVVTPLVGTFRMGGATPTSIREMLDAVCDAYQLGERPLTQPGSDGRDQIVESSPELITGRSFRDALLADL